LQSLALASASSGPSTSENPTFPCISIAKPAKSIFTTKVKTYVEEWDKLVVYLKAQFGVNATGAPIRDLHVNVEFDNDDGSTFTVFLMDVERMGFTSEH
jgi:hypothetical protein